jgi:hypothetical protein
MAADTGKPDEDRWRCSRRGRIGRDDDCGYPFRVEPLNTPRRITLVGVGGLILAAVIGGVANAVNLSEGVTLVVAGAAVALVAGLGVPWALDWRAPRRDPGRSPAMADFSYSRGEEAAGAAQVTAVSSERSISSRGTMTSFVVIAAAVALTAQSPQAGSSGTAPSTPDGSHHQTGPATRRTGPDQD